MTGSAVPPGNEPASSTQGRQAMQDDVMDDQALSPELSEQMEQYGIVRYAVYHYRIGNYSYRRLEDAVAQAERHSREQ